MKHSDKTKKFIVWIITAALSAALLYAGHAAVIGDAEIMTGSGSVAKAKVTELGIYYEDESLLPEIRARVGREAERLGQPLAVEVGPLENFYEAEEYHQKYLEKHPGGYCHIPGSMMHIAKGAK